MAKKQRKHEKLKPWCWYCDREFDEEKVLIQHQRMKHFKCNICHRKLNSASGLVIHMAQVHKDKMEKVPNAVEGHDTPELEIFGMDGVPQDDLQRHIDGLSLVPYNKNRMIIGDSSILPILAAQKVSVAYQLAESKNMTVQGMSDGTSPPTGSITSPPTSAGPGLHPPSANNPSTSNPYYSYGNYPQPQQPYGSYPQPQQPYGSYSQPQQPYGNPQQQQQPQQQQPQQQQPQQQQSQQQQQQQYAAAAAYYQQYYAQQYQQYYANSQMPLPTGVPPIALAASHHDHASLQPESQVQEISVEAETEEQHPQEEDEDYSEGTLMIPPHVDPNTGKTVAGIIFVAPSIQRSLEELRARLTRYQ